MSVIPKEELGVVEQQLAFYSRVHPDVISLAMLASLARRVEAGLLRALRLKLGHHFPAESQPHVGTEAALWFSSLVESRGLDSMTLLPGVLHLLRERLREWPELLEEAREIISDCHRAVPPIIGWEEDVVYYGLSPALEGGRRFELLRQAALSARKALANRGGRGLDELLDEISRRIPVGVAQHPDFGRLITLSQQRVRTSRSFSLGATGERGENAAGLPTKELRIRKDEGEILVGELSGHADFRINVPNVTPLMIQASETPEGTDAVSYLVPEGSAVNIPAPRGRVYLHALDGSWYEITLPPPPDFFPYDVFLAYTSKDKSVVQRLAERLEADGIRVWFDIGELRLGDSISSRIEEALGQSRVLLLFMSANAFESDWEEIENYMFRFRNSLERRRRLIPVRLDDHELRGYLSQYVYIDWRKPSDAEYKRLLEAVRDPKQAQQVTGAKELSLAGHAGPVLSVVMSPDGETILSGSWDNTIRLWRRTSGALQHTIAAHDGYVTSMAAAGDLLVSGSWDGTVKVWDWQKAVCRRTLAGHAGPVLSVALSPSVSTIASGSEDETVRVWDADSGSLIQTLEGHEGSVFSVAFAPDGRWIVSGGADGSVRCWEAESGGVISSRMDEAGMVLSVAVMPDARAVVYGSTDRTIKIWSQHTGNIFYTLEGHLDAVTSVAVTPDGRRIVSGSADGTVRVWDSETGRCVRVLEGHTNSVLALAIARDGRHLVSGDSDHTVRISEFPPDEPPAERPAVYASAKVVLVGDSGVGKTALATRLAEARFEPTDSTQGHTVWRLPSASAAAAGGVEREIWLWDYPGQEGNRLLHQFFLSDSALAVLVFDPQHESPFESLSFWDNFLKGTSRSPVRKLLVAGRADRGGLMVSRAAIKKFMRERGYDRYFETSARDARGFEELSKAIVAAIPWDDIPYVSTPPLFRRLRQEILGLKDEGEVLLRTSELKGRLDTRLTGESFSHEEVRAVVGSMTKQGLVWQLEFEDHVLLQPFLLSLYASAVVRVARQEPDGLGGISEEAAQAGELSVGGDLPRLPKDKEATVIRAVFELLVGLGVCFREKTPGGTLLVFPAYVTRARPTSEPPLPPTVTYRFSGFVAETYAALVTRLRTIPDYDRVTLWRHAADFDSRDGDRMVIEVGSQLYSEGVLRICFGKGLADSAKARHLGYVQTCLREKATDITRIRHYICPRCDQLVRDDEAVQARLRRGLKDIVCMYCDNRIPLVDVLEEMLVSEDTGSPVRKSEEGAARASVEAASLAQMITGYVFSVVAEAGQIYRPLPYSDGLIDGEIEFKNDRGDASGRRVYLKLESGDLVLLWRREGDREVFTAREPRHLDYWRNQTSPVMLVLWTPDGLVRWMNVTEYLKRRGPSSDEIVFAGEPFDAISVVRMRDRVLGRAQEGEGDDRYELPPLDNQSREALLIGRMYSIVGEAGHIFRPTPNASWGIGGEIEFRDDDGNPSGRRVYLNLKSGDSHLRRRKRDGAEVFGVKNPRHVEHWLSLGSPVMLVILTSDGTIRWMDLTAHLKRRDYKHVELAKHIVFDGVPCTASSVSQMRNRIL